MKRHKFSISVRLVLAASLTLALCISLGMAQNGSTDKDLKLRGGKITDAQKKAAALRAAEAGLVLGTNAFIDYPGVNQGPGGIPHYFGPYANWAFSPLPKGAVSEISVTSPGSGYTSPVVTIKDAYGNGTGASATAVLGNGVIISLDILTPGSGYVDPIVTITDGNGGTGAEVQAVVGPTADDPPIQGAIVGFTIVSGGSGYANPTVMIADNIASCGGADMPACGSGATATAKVGNAAIVGFTGLDGGADYVAPIVEITDDTGTGATANALVGGPVKGGIRKFVDRLPGLGPAGANNLGQYIPIAQAETRTFSGEAADYYEIALIEYEKKLHTDLVLPTRLRGYVQLATAAVPGKGIALKAPDGSAILLPNGQPAIAVDEPNYLGPLIIAQGRVHGIAGDAGKPRPVRIKFYNLLPAGSGGNLFIPVDRSVPGAGYGPAVGNQSGLYTDNRATIHLHGNNTVWISDGNVHQWISPADEITPYAKGVSVRNVPDMFDADNAVDCDVAPLGKNSSGCMTFYYTNAQSARLQFYHDHAHGITRLNVYVGQAAGYVLRDAVEKDMIEGTNVSGVNPGLMKVLPADEIPLIIQDKTFVDANTIYATDPTWNWGTAPGTAVEGNLWYPHVYMTVQNPWDLTGTNAFGKWHYGPWFNPPVPTCVNGGPVGCVEVGPVPNPYHQPICDTNPNDAACTAPWEPPMMPGNPNPSAPGESFFDTMMVNGTPYPYLEVDPKAYRFRVLNASNDRFVNLQLYVAADKNTPTTPDATGTLLCDDKYDAGADNANLFNCTEVKMVPANGAPNQFAETPSGLPDPTTAGPEWIMIGTEGGFLPKPVVVPQQPIGWNLDMGYFAFGIVNQFSLYLGAAERADVVVDFSKYAGKTLILYNDSPAPVPAGAGVFDFYTGDGNQMDAGGAPNTLPGYGPNTRTVMQIRVKPTAPAAPYDLAALESVFAKTDAKRGVFEVSQDPIIIPQAAYNSAYNTTFPTTVPGQYFQIGDKEKTFNPINADGTPQPPVTLPLQMKAMHDEMGGVYDMLYGRMSGMLGVSLPNSPNHVLIPFGLASPPVDMVSGSLETTPIGIMPDGTQIWRIFHNGVDTHPIHTHLFHAQLVNRVDQSGQVTAGTQPVDPQELGWKDTFKINPLEVTFIAMRPTAPLPDQIPFEVPDSVRLIDPTLPEGATLLPPPPAGWFDPAGNVIPEILNHYVNFGWEYVWHCHILSHEEMDMMHSLVYVVPPKAPTQAPLALAVQGNKSNITVSWVDNSIREESFTVERASDSNFTTGLVTFNVGAAANTGSTVSYLDNTVSNNSTYWYRVYANGATVGDTQAYANSVGFPTMSANSVSNTESKLVGATPGTPNAPINLVAALQAGPQVGLTWTDTATNETGFAIYRCAGVGCVPVQFATAARRNNTGSVTYTDAAVAAGNSYSYLVYAVNSSGRSAAPSNTVSVAIEAVPAAPTSFKLTNMPASGRNSTMTLDWGMAVDPISFTIQRATNLSFTTGLSTFTAAADLRTLTQTVRDNTVYYYRIRANSAGGSSEWKNADKFPIRTIN